MLFFYLSKKITAHFLLESKWIYTNIMNFIYALITTIIILSPFQQGVPYSKLDSAFDQKNADAIVSISKDKVLMKILGKEGAYSKSQAILILKEFFSDKSNGSFNFTFKGTDSSSGTFAIGSFSSGSNKYRVTIHFSNVSNEYKIESITIEKD